MNDLRISQLLVVTVVAILATTACDRDRLATPLSDTEIQELTDGQPDIFVEKKGTLTLQGIEDLYLGQSYDDAMEVLDDYCEQIMTFEGGWRHSDATFKGCDVFKDEGGIKTLRAGFWPFADNRLSTLEVRDQSISMPVVRARFSQVADELREDLPRRGILMMQSTQYRLIASWDDGTDEPVHITIGFHPP